jgi:AraC family transcriptional regulator, melibiose operon regulatory protein
MSEKGMRTFGFSAWQGRTHSMPTPHAHDDVEINLSPQTLFYLCGGDRVRLPAGRPCAFWGARPHRLVDADGGCALSYATVPLAQFLSWSVPEAVTGALLRGSVLVGQAPAASAALDVSFARWAGELASADPLVRLAARREVEALVYRMSSCGGWGEEAGGGVVSERAADRARRMSAYIARNHTRDIHVADVAAVIPLHPDRAARLFREVLGTTIASHIAQFRVAEAQRLLLTTDLPAVAIAGRVGFGSLSTFHAVFLRHSGSSPVRWRAAHARPTAAPAAMTH